jgi:hypothetical protein
MLFSGWAWILLLHGYGNGAAAVTVLPREYRTEQACKAAGALAAKAMSVEFVCLPPVSE